MVIIIWNICRNENVFNIEKFHTISKCYNLKFSVENEVQSYECTEAALWFQISVGLT